MNPQIEETRVQIDKRKVTPRCMIVKPKNSKDKEQILKVGRGEKSK